MSTETKETVKITCRPLSGLRRVSFYTASPVETCDRCGQGIKHVALIEFKDGTRQRFGMDCINKILDGDTSLKCVFAKNQKLLKQYTANLQILSRAPEDMPIDTRGYYDRGLYFVADDTGQSLFHNGHSVFHPTVADDKAFTPKPGASNTLDMRPVGSAWAEFNRDNWKAKCMHVIEQDRVWLASEIERISSFLARVITKASLAPKEAK